MSPTDVPRVANLQYLRILEETVDPAFAELTARVADHPCRRGCDACCHGPFDIGPAAAWLLVEGIGTLAEPVRRTVLRAIAAAATATREAAGCGLDDPVSIEHLGEEAFDAVCDALADVPCPLLVDHACAAYAYRPLPCRLTGAVHEWPDGALDMDCPIGLTEGAPAALLDVDSVVTAVERLDDALPIPSLGSVRTTIALALDAILRSGSRP